MVKLINGITVEKTATLKSRTLGYLDDAISGAGVGSLIGIPLGAVGGAISNNEDRLTGALAGAGVGGAAGTVGGSLGGTLSSILSRNAHYANVKKMRGVKNKIRHVEGLIRDTRGYAPELKVIK